MYLLLLGFLIRVLDSPDETNVTNALCVYVAEFNTQKVVASTLQSVVPFPMYEWLEETQYVASVNFLDRKQDDSLIRTGKPDTLSLYK